VHSVEKNETIYPQCVFTYKSLELPLCVYIFIHSFIIPESVIGTGPIVMELVITYIVHNIYSYSIYIKN